MIFTQRANANAKEETADDTGTWKQRANHPEATNKTKAGRHFKRILSIAYVPLGRILLVLTLYIP